MKVTIFSLLMMLSSASAFAAESVCTSYVKTGPIIEVVIGRNSLGTITKTLIPLNEAAADFIANQTLPQGTICFKGTLNPNGIFAYEISNPVSGGAWPPK